jgi:tetratricopeptide (TPR) repeat protein
MKTNYIGMIYQSQTSLVLALLIYGLTAALPQPVGAAAPRPPSDAPDTNSSPAAVNAAATENTSQAIAPVEADTHNVPGNAATDERLRMYLQADESKSMAEWLKQQNMLEDAADIFQEALGLYRNLAEQYPGWQTELVNFRIKYCEKELAGLAETPSSAPPAGLPAQFARETSPALDAARNTARIRRAAQLEKVSDLPAALALYQEILDETPQHPGALQGAARIYLRMRRIEPARTALRQAAQLPANDDTTLLLQALLFCHDGDFHAARRTAETLLKRNPYNASAHMIMGAVLADTGRLEEAEEAMKRAITLNPKLGDAYYNLAQISLRRQPIDLEKTRHHYQNAIKYGADRDPALEALLN